MVNPRKGLGPRWEWVVNATFRPLYPGKTDVFMEWCLIMPYLRPNFLYPQELDRFRLNLAFTLHGFLPILFRSVMARYNVFLK